MRILDAAVTDVRHRRDFGRVEARVALTFQPSPGAPAQTRTFLTSAPARDPRGRDLRARLVTDAVRMALATAPAPLAEAA